MPKNRGPSLFHNADAAAPQGSEHVELHNEDVRFEPKDVNAKNVIVTGICVLIGVWLVVFMVYFVLSSFENQRASVEQPPIPVASQRTSAPPEPRIQASPRTDLQRYEAQQSWLLTHYFWINKSKGVVAIPIEHAMELIAQRGIPPQKAPAGLALSTPAEGNRLTGFEGKVEPEPR